MAGKAAAWKAAVPVRWRARGTRAPTARSLTGNAAILAAHGRGGMLPMCKCCQLPMLPMANWVGAGLWPSRHQAASRDWRLGQDEQDFQDPQECAWEVRSAEDWRACGKRAFARARCASILIAMSWRSWESCRSWFARWKMESLSGGPPTSSGIPCGRAGARPSRTNH